MGFDSVQADMETSCYSNGDSRMIYHTYQQLPPIQVGDTWQANIKMRDNVEASSEQAAIVIARNLEVFRRAQGLARFPMVEEAC